MKQILVLILAMFSIAVRADSPPDPIPLETNPFEEPGDVEIFRSPAQNLVEAFYDSDSHSVIITGDPTIEAEVFLYDEDGNLEDFSHSLNSTLRVTSNGFHTILIITDYWFALGHINLLAP